MLTAGEQVAGYRIEGVLGQGGMGVVYRATQLSLERTVALKVVAGHLGNDPTFRERFRREGRIQAGLDHPNIITIYEAGESPEGLFIAMRLVDGVNLKELLLSGELTPVRLLGLLKQTADALDAAHEAGLIHRDIKPQNVLVGAGGRSFLADFGLTKPPGLRSLTQSGQFVGSLDYISPEQIHGQPATRLSDIYSFGVVAFECLTGAVPYARESEAAILFAHVSEPPPPASDVNPLLPRQLDDILARALAKSPDRRFPTAGSFVAALDAVGSKLPGVAPQAKQGYSVPSLTATGEIDDRPSAPSGETIVDPGRVTPPPLSPVSRERLLTSRSVAIALAVFTGFAVAGAAVGRASNSTNQAEAEGVVPAQRGITSFARPESWESGPGPKSKYGMTIRNSLQIVSPTGLGSASLIAGTVDGRGKTLLPTADTAPALTVDPAQRTVVRLGRVQAYAYRGRDRDLVAYFTPTKKGVITVVCENRGGPPTVLARCLQIANTLRLEAPPFPLGPSPAFARVLTRALARARSTEARELRAMVRAEATSAQGAAARRIAAAFKAARATLERTAVSPEVAAAKRGIVTSLWSVERAYRQVAAAASRADRKRYASVSRVVVAADRELVAAVNRLRAYGYRTR